MPVDLSKNETPEEQQLKRARGELSCAECARLKVRCDKKVPCGSCVRRGCPTICPNGSLSGGHGTRFVLANTEQLHKKMFDMSERIRSLEDALENMQRSHSSNSHPLLRDELKAIKSGIDVYDTKRLNDEAKAAEVIDDFGLLSISEQGVTRFFGRTAGTESLLALINSEVITSEKPSTDPRAFLPVNTLPKWLYKSTSAAPADILLAIETRLPTWERGLNLCEIYLETSHWLIKPLKRLQLVDEIFIPIYRRMAERSKARSSSESPREDTPGIQHIQDIALLFIVFAIGASFDTTIPPYNDEAEDYHQITRYLTSLEMMAEHPTLVGVQTLLLLGAYNVLYNRMGSTEIGFATTSLASVFAAAIGLHRDPAKWNLECEVVQIRREVFWQVFVVDMIQCLENGRPTIFVEHHRDSPYPKDEESVRDAAGNLEPGFWDVCYRFSNEISFPVNHICCSVSQVPYEKILELDKKLQNFYIPPHLQAPIFRQEDSFELCMQRFMTLLHAETAILYLHRSHFSRALLDQPNLPTNSRYSRSFKATYDSALVVIGLARQMYEVYPTVATRTWLLWKHTFGALLIIASIVTRGPSSEYAEAALVALVLGVGVFEKLAAYELRKKHLLSVLHNLSRKACQAFRDSRHGELPSIVKEIQGYNTGASSQSHSRNSSYPGPMSPFTDSKPSILLQDVYSDKGNPLGASYDQQQQQMNTSKKPYWEAPNYGSGPSRPTEVGSFSPAAAMDSNRNPFGWDSTAQPSSSYSTNASNLQIGQQLPPLRQEQYGPNETELYGLNLYFGDQYPGPPSTGVDLGQQQIPQYYSSLPDGSTNPGVLGGPVNSAINQNAFGPGDEWMSFAMNAGLLDQGFMPSPGQSYNM